MVRIILAAASTLALAACAVGPEYHRPIAPQGAVGAFQTARYRWARR